MEGLGGFDDDLFEASRDREACKAPVSYNAKFIQPLWFDHEEKRGDDADYQYQLRFSADRAYYTAQYQQALVQYQQSLALLEKANITVWRELNEAIAHCHSHLGHVEEATTTVQNLLDRASTFEQKTSAWQTAARVYSRINNNHEARVMLCALCTLHYGSPEYWHRLGDLYTTQPDRQAACYMRARILLGFVAPTISGFAKERNLSTQKELQSLLDNLDLTDDQHATIAKCVRESMYNYSDESSENGEKSGEENEAVLTDHQLATQIDPRDEDFYHSFVSKHFSCISS